MLNQLKTAFLSTSAAAIIIAGPGFIKNAFFSFLKEKDQELAKSARTEQVSSVGTEGFIEVLKRGAVERLTKEARLLDTLMEEISKEKDGNIFIA